MFPLYNILKVFQRLAFLPVLLLSCVPDRTVLTGTELEIVTDVTPTRSADPVSDVVTDLNIMLFRQDGIQEEGLWLNGDRLQPTAGGYTCRLNTLAGISYDIFVLANLGYPLGPMSRAVSYTHLTLPTMAVV